MRFPVLVAASAAVVLGMPASADAAPATPCSPLALAPFEDVGASFAHHDIACLVEAGLVSGTSPSTYHPESFLARDQMAVLLAGALEAAGVPDPAPAAAPPFTDIAGSFAEGDILTLAAMGVTSGVAPGRFEPSGTVTREQMAIFLVRLTPLLGIQLPATPPALFTDTAGSFARVEIDILAALNITAGVAPGRFDPGAPVTREQMAVFLASLLDDAGVTAVGGGVGLDTDAVLLVDGTTGGTILARAPDQRRAMASTTKLMTALVALDHLALDTPVFVSSGAAAIGEAEIGLVPGETLPARDLLAAVLTRSANDAAMALAEAAGETVAGFVDLMNARAAALGLLNTHYANPHGLDATGHYTTAADLLTLTQAAMANPVIAALVALPEYVLPPAPGGTEPRIAINTNRLLGSYRGVIGAKTGFTSDAELCISAVAERDGRRLYAIVLGSVAHFSDAVALLDYGFAVL